MKLTRSSFTVWLLLPVLASTSSAVCAEDWHADLSPFLKDHCLACHSGADSEGGLNLAELDSDLNDAERLRRWTLVHDRVTAGEMPPPDQPEPDAKQRAAAVSTLSTALTAADQLRNDVVLRRLNRIEYENTVRDLFGTFVQVRHALPQDSSVAGFDNVGEGLAVSAEGAQAWLVAADLTLDAVFGPAKQPTFIRHETNLLQQKTHDGKLQLESQIGKMFRRTEHGLVIFQSGYCPTNLVNFSRLRASAGTYRGSLKVRAVQSTKPVTLRIYGGDTIVGRREQHLVGYFDVPPDEWTTIEFTDRLFEDNGTFLPKCYGTKDTRKDADTYPEPGIEIGDILIEGPLEEWPPPSRGQLLGGLDLQQAGPQDAAAILQRLLPRAFRRPVDAEEVRPFADLTAAALADGRDFENALRLGLKGILCAPEFLFLDEPTQADGQITQHALASRLSYFLWSSMPDERLQTLANEGRLRDTQVLRGEVERMLNDDRSAAFVENFVGQWLDLREINFTSPDANLYPDFDELLQVSMVEETQRFFREILNEDLSVTNFVDSDFTFLNQRLATHYGISGVEGHQQFRKVMLPEDSVRGGVLTHASVLKVTANGTTTSPVLRGAWVMENLLGQHIPPPPANVAAVEPDIRGAVTLREQLAKHRDVDSCAACHDKIDPPGFALENFDVIGGWRERYRTLGDGQRPEFGRDPHTFAWIRYRIGLPVDATGQLPDGQPFADIRDFRKLLLQNKNAIAKGLTEKLATYALGRRIGFSDRPAIQKIVNQSASQDYGLRTLIHEIVSSELFHAP